jgi:hypothetical protein
MPESKQIHIFATRSDLEPGLKRFESEKGVKYALSGLLYSPIFEQYGSLLEWTELGKNTTGDHISGPMFLVVPKNAEIKVEPVPQVNSGEIRYALNQKLNPDSITFYPGGLYREGVLVCGDIGTIWKTPASLDLYKRFVQSVTKTFAKIGSYRVGSEAERLMDKGYRMVTISIRSPREYDLSR